MIEPVPARVPKLCRLLLFGGYLLAVAACGEDRRTSLSLAANLEVAEVEGEAESLGADIRVLAGASLTYHFPIPDEARLVGNAASRGGAVARVELRDESGDEHVLWEGVGSLDQDLSPYSGRMLRLRFSVTGEDRAEVVWQQLRIEGALDEPPRADTARASYNVLLMLFDSLRADDTAPYGATEVRTPALRALADSGVTFVRARSSASWTRPAVGAMFTSLAPPSHGILSYQDKLRRSAPYLPEILRDAGYHTVAVLNTAMVSGYFGFARGFDQTYELFGVGDPLERREDPSAKAAEVWSRFIEPALEEAGSRPFFVYLHELDPHSPYDPPESFGALYDFGYRGGAESTIDGLRAMRVHPEEVTEADVRFLRSRYRGEITYMDRYLDAILRALAAAGLEKKTVVVLVSDHGEEFWDHRSVGHGHALYEELLRVPFVMRLEGVIPRGLRSEMDVGLLDLAPTLLDLLGIEPPESMQGESLLPYLDSRAAAGHERAHFGYAAVPPTESVSFGRWKLIREMANSPARVALFDLEEDPGEESNVADEEPVVVGSLEQMLRRERARARPPERDTVAPGEMPTSVLENLRALGYTE